MRFKDVTVSLNLPMVGSIKGSWEPTKFERSASWEMYVELITRVSTNEIKEEEGILREALSSFYALFDITRQILKKYGPDIAIPTKDNISFGYLAVSILNSSLRPLLSKWHSLLLEHESKRNESISIFEHEKNWDKYGELRKEIEFVRQILLEYANLLGTVAGVPSLII
ncbi:hypothetical protein [Priestia endophytica]|uniref:hypothetical protein n=1 Tax=Priestia endophytica TaxID=135735 RepID=UPI000F53B417|nr:hypothetical protein [Priestia endophytica]RPJ99320.1 hypothetical protein FH5_03518 [Priestia endophytica]